MDLAIRIEMYKNFAIMPPEKPLLPDMPCIRETAAEKEAYEDGKVPAQIRGTISQAQKNIYADLNKKKTKTG